MAPIASNVLWAETCAHDIQPTENPDWGRCSKCGDASFPMTERAAYGEVACATCMDTGLVPAQSEHGFADRGCPDCLSDL